MKLIDKDKVVAEIEKRFDEYTSSILKHYDAYKEAKAQELGKILTILDILEVKEVDLEKEFESFLDNIEGVPRMWHSDEQIEWAKDIARHFFELGLKLQKGE